METYDDEYLNETLNRAFASPDHYRFPTGIIRYDYAHTHGWWVRIKRDRAQFQKMFFDLQSGSIENALRLAIQYRNEVLAAFPVTITKTNPRTLSPDPEKRIHLKTESGTLQPYISWQAKWHDSNYNIKTKHFSVKKFGHDEARRLALESTKANHNPIPKVYVVHDSHDKVAWKEVLREDVAVQASVNSDPYRNNQSLKQIIAASDPFGFEGERKLVLHLSIERNRKLRAEKIAEFLQRYGRLHCELCSFRFIENYPFLVSDIIEVHHVVPLGKLSSGTLVKTSELMLLCSNCHTAVHQGDAEENLIRAMIHFELDGNK